MFEENSVEPLTLEHCANAALNVEEKKQLKILMDKLIMNEDELPKNKKRANKLDETLIEYLQKLLEEIECDIGKGLIRPLINWKKVQ